MPPNSHSASTKVQRFRAARLLLRVALAATAIAALLLLLTQEILPWALRRVIAERGAETAGMRVEVGRIDISLIRREISIEDISLTSSTGGALRSLRCRRARAAVHLADLARGRVALAEVDIAQPDLEIGSADPSSAQANEHAASFGWPVRVDRISILEARVQTRISEEREVEVHIPAVLATGLEIPGAGGESPWHLAGLSVEPSLALISRAEAEPLSVSFSGKASNAAPDAAFPIEVKLARAEATLTLSGLVHVGELRIDGSIFASQVELAPLLARVDRRVPVVGGRVSGRLALAVARQADGQYLVQLTPLRDRPAEKAIEVDDLELEILGASRRSVTSSEVSAVVEEIRIVDLPASPRIDAHLSRVDLAHLRIEIVRPLLALDRPPGNASEGSQPIRIASRAVQIEDGFLTFLDETTDPPFRGRWSHVNGQLDQFSWPQLDIGQLVVEASGVGGDPVRISGQVSPEGSELSIQGRGDSLVRYSPQVTARTGLEVIGGAGSLDSTVRIDRSEVRAPAHLVLSQLELKSDHPTLSLDRLGEMPLAVALALLTDAGGDITLDLDLAFGRKEIGIDWLSLVSAGLQRSLVRATTAPLRLIGALTASGSLPEAPATWLGFVPGRASLSEEGRHRVRALAKLLAERPELAIRLHATATDADLAASERRADSDLDDDQWIADLEARRALAVASLLQDEYGVVPDRVRVGAAEFATLHPEPGVAIALDARSLPGTPEIPGFPQPEHGPSTPAVAAPPE